MSLNNSRSGDYKFKNYNVTINLNDDSNIYINFINSITYRNYECIIDDNIINCKIDTFYNILQRCFIFEKNYDIKLELQFNILIMNVSVNFDGYYNISQSVPIKENLDNNNKLTLKFNELEIKFNNEIIKFDTKNLSLKNEITNLKNEIINLKNEIANLKWNR